MHVFHAINIANTAYFSVNSLQDNSSDEVFDANNWACRYGENFVEVMLLSIALTRTKYTRTWVQEYSS